MNCLAMYKKDSPHNAKANKGCPVNANITPSTLSNTTGIINHITLSFLLV